jgi:hypothetical protein
MPEAYLLNSFRQTRPDSGIRDRTRYAMKTRPLSAASSDHCLSAVRRFSSRGQKPTPMHRSAISMESPMRHSPARRSVLTRIGRRVRLADQARERPRHSGPLAQAFTGSGPRRTLRLAMLIGGAGACFCVVLAMIGLVVELGGPGPPVGRKTQVAVAPKKSETAGLRPAASAAYHLGSAKGRFLAGATVALYRGSGSVNSRKFKVREPGDWGIYWRFTCPLIRIGSFTMSETGSKDTKDIELSASGPNGHGISWHIHDPGDHSLTIISNCSWLVSIVLPRRENRLRQN